MKTLWDLQLGLKGVLRPKRGRSAARGCAALGVVFVGHGGARSVTPPATGG